MKQGPKATWQVNKCPKLHDFDNFSFILLSILQSRVRMSLSAYMMEARPGKSHGCRFPANTEDRTLDLSLTKRMLYQLSYACIVHARLSDPIHTLIFATGDLEYRSLAVRQLLCRAAKDLRSKHASDQ